MFGKLYDETLYKQLPCIDIYHQLCLLNCYRIVISIYGYSPLNYLNHALAIKGDSFYMSGKFDVSPYSCKPLIDDYGDNILFFKNELGWEMITEYLNKGILCILLVDVYYLPYKTYFLNKHGSHAIIVDGLKEGNVHILDWYMPDRYNGWIDIEIINMARKSSGFNDLLLAFTENDIDATWIAILNNFDQKPTSKYAVRQVLLFSIRSMLSSDKETGLNFLCKIGKVGLKWDKFEEVKYSNLIKSLHYCELERKIHTWYLHSMIQNNEFVFCIQLNKEILKVIGILKYMILKAYTKKVIFDLTAWENKCNELYELNKKLIDKYICLIERLN